MERSSDRPLLSPCFDTIPSILRDRPQWLVWRAEWDEPKGKYSKIPVDAKTGRAGSSTNAATWSSFEVAKNRYLTSRQPFGGVGFVLSEDDEFVGIDFDHCVFARRVDSEVQNKIDEIGSYAEISPSESGVRVFAIGNLPPGGRRKGNVEIYDSGRFLTVTGRRISGTPIEIYDRQREIEAFHGKLFPPVAPRKSGPSSGSGMINAQDCDILQKAVSGKNGGRISALLAGNFSAYADGSHSGRSEGDMALASLLAFWTGPNPSQLDRLVRNSGLMREKWDERHYADGRTYGEAIIERAIALCTTFYNPER